jgi:hypothetical protein
MAVKKDVIGVRRGGRWGSGEWVVATCQGYSINLEPFTCLLMLSRGFTAFFSNKLSLGGLPCIAPKVVLIFPLISSPFLAIGQHSIPHHLLSCSPPYPVFFNLAFLSNTTRLVQTFVSSFFCFNVHGEMGNPQLS